MQSHQDGDHHIGSVTSALRSSWQFCSVFSHVRTFRTFMSKHRNFSETRVQHMLCLSQRCMWHTFLDIKQVHPCCPLHKTISTCWSCQIILTNSCDNLSRCNKGAVAFTSTQDLCQQACRCFCQIVPVCLTKFVQIENCNVEGHTSLTCRPAETYQYPTRHLLHAWDVQSPR